MQKAIFLDRDGVINEVLTKRVKFDNEPEDLFLLQGVGEAIHLFNASNLPVFVVTNQGGIGLGYMTEGQLHNIHDNMQEDLSAFDAHIQDIAYCPHKPQAKCRCRKPSPQMIVDLAKTYHISLAESYMIGDRSPDIEAGKRAGTKTIFVGNRKEETN